jgi:hypothetical protein
MLMFHIPQPKNWKIFLNRFLIGHHRIWLWFLLLLYVHCCIISHLIWKYFIVSGIKYIRYNSFFLCQSNLTTVVAASCVLVLILHLVWFQNRKLGTSSMWRNFLKYLWWFVPFLFLGYIGQQLQVSLAGRKMNVLYQYNCYYASFKTLICWTR